MSAKPTAYASPMAGPGLLKLKSSEDIVAATPVPSPCSDMKQDEQDAVFHALIKSKTPFGIPTPEEVRRALPLMKRVDYKQGEAVFAIGDVTNHLYFVLEGTVDLKVFGHTLVSFSVGQTFGELGFAEESRKRGADMVCRTDCSMVYMERVDVLNDEKLPSEIAAHILLYVNAQIVSLLQGYHVYRELPVLIIQDGGCSPGYDSVTSALTEAFESLREETSRVYAAAEGFKSVVSGTSADFRYLIHDERLFRYVSMVPGVVLAEDLKHARGASFRTERYPAFKEEENQRRAAQNIIARGVRVLVCVGGNGTFMGAKMLARFLPDSVKVFFVPATIDSDVSGTECLGEHTAVETGSEKLRCYMADAATHHRCYILEMMGRDSGFHCVNSVLGAGADLAVIPGSQIDLSELGKYITARQHSVIAVAEGYQRHERQKLGFQGSASEWLLKQLRENGSLDEEKRRVVTEPFSRDIRGALPNNVDIVLAQKMARGVVEAAAQGKSHVMPTVKSGVTGLLPFSEVQTNNAVDPSLCSLANRIRPSFENFAGKP